MQYSLISSPHIPSCTWVLRKYKRALFPRQWFGVSWLFNKEAWMLATPSASHSFLLFSRDRVTHNISKAESTCHNVLENKWFLLQTFLCLCRHFLLLLSMSYHLVHSYAQENNKTASTASDSLFIINSVCNHVRQREGGSVAWALNMYGAVTIIWVWLYVHVLSNHTCISTLKLTATKSYGSWDYATVSLILHPEALCVVNGQAVNSSFDSHCSSNLERIPTVYTVIARHFEQRESKILSNVIRQHWVDGPRRKASQKSHSSLQRNPHAQCD